MSERQRRATATELLRLHPPGDHGMCECGRPLPCPVAIAARDTLDQPQPQPQPAHPRAVGRAGVRYWAPRWGLMARASGLRP